MNEVHRVQKVREKIKMTVSGEKIYIILYAGGYRGKSSLLDISRRRDGLQAATRIRYKRFNLGNKWSAIALRMPGHTENSVKNKFYSTLRKGLRKINKYIGNIRRKTHKKDLSNNKLLKPDFLTKLTAIADRNFE